MEKHLEREFSPERYPFSVRTLAEDKLIGFFSLYVELTHSNGWVGSASVTAISGVKAMVQMR